MQPKDVVAATLIRDGPVISSCESAPTVCEKHFCLSLPAHSNLNMSHGSQHLANPTPGMGVLPWLDDFLMTQHSHKAAVASSAFCRSEMQALASANWLAAA